ncbi:hypothetical protein F383_30114 [Gossypium arboreum]|uniref:Uncharacterized protein n=1 Tax=Gossypium arboreum TaxID=29729 RepID=A0A0B0PEU3_GOSAR|nr:hypothetical protein F383_30114 [Gossypium arboreum]
MWYKSVYPLIGTRPSTLACDSFWHSLMDGLAHESVWPL